MFVTPSKIVAQTRKLNCELKILWEETLSLYSKEIGLLAKLSMNLVLCVFLICVNTLLNIPALPHSFIQVFCLLYYLMFQTACVS